MKEIILNNGVKIPVLGFGVFKIEDKDTEKAVLQAFEAGYRHIDTAQIYENEQGVGKAVNNSGINREEIFVTTKIWTENVSYDGVLASFERSLKRLNLDYVDMLLIHKPYNDVYGAWRAMQKLYEEGLVRAIGLSNFEAYRVVDIGEFNTIKPQVSQVEINPFIQRQKEVAQLKDYGTTPQGWAPLARGRGDIFNNETLLKIANAHQKSVAQVIIRFFVEKEIPVVVKSISKERMKENISVFDFKLNGEEISEIEKINQEQTQFIDLYTPEEVRQISKRIYGY